MRRTRVPTPIRSSLVRMDKPTDRPGRRLIAGAAIAVWAVAVGGAAAGLALRVVDPVPVVASTFGFTDGALLAFAVLGVAWATVGAILVVRRPENLVGRYMLIVGAGYALSTLSAAVTFKAAASSDLQLTRTAGWWTVVLSSIGALALYLAFIFPTGRGHTAGWQRVGHAFLACMGIGFAWLVTQPGPLHLFPGIDNPIPIGPDLRPWLGPRPSLTVVGVSLLAVPLVVAGVVSRYRMAGRVQRAQLKWAFLGLGLSVGALIATEAVAMLPGSPSGVPLLLYALSGTLVPIAIGIAILRHHLFDIDRIVSRTIGWSLISGLLVAAFAAGVVGLQAVLSGFTQGQTIAVAASTLLAFALFQPLRRRVQSAVDRRFDRSRYDGQLTADAFAERLRGEVAIDAVAADLSVTVEQAVRPTAQGLWLRTVRERSAAVGP